MVRVLLYRDWQDGCVACVAPLWLQVLIACTVHLVMRILSVCTTPNLAPLDTGWQQHQQEQAHQLLHRAMY